MRVLLCFFCLFFFFSAVLEARWLALKLEPHGVSMSAVKLNPESLDTKFTHTAAVLRVSGPSFVVWPSRGAE